MRTEIVDKTIQRKISISDTVKKKKKQSQQLFFVTMSTIHH